MKIAVLGTRGFPGVQGGVEVHCENLYKRLAKRGCHIVVFSRASYVGRDVPKIEGIEMIAVEVPKNKYLEAIVHTYKSVWLAKQLRPDIVHIHAIGPSVCALVARMLGMKVVVTNHGPDYQRKKWPFAAKLFLRFCEAVGIASAHGVIAIAQNIADSLKKRFKKVAYVIPNGVEIPQRLTSVSEGPLTQLKLEAGHYILAVGRLVPEKGYDVLMGAFNDLCVSDKSFDPKWKLAIVGQADFEDRYSINLKRKALNNPRIVLAGFQTGVPLSQLYSQAGLFVLPSFYEGLPIVLLEAMSYGLSCIVSDIPANRNVPLAEDRFFKPGDAAILAEKMMYFSNHPMTDQDKNQQIRMIGENYNWENIADATLAVYKNILSTQ